MSEEKIVEEKITEETLAEENVTEKNTTPEAGPQTDTDDVKSKIELNFGEDDIPPKRFFSSCKDDMNFLRDKWILSRIKDEDLMEYLRLEQKRNDQLMQAKEIRSKRIFSAFQLTVSLAAAVAIVYFLKDTPTLLVNILYIAGILGGFWIWKKNQK